MEINKKVRLHLPLIAGIETALEEIFFNQRKSDQVIPGILKSNPKWGSRDRSFVAENTYEIVRNKRFIMHCLAIEELSVSNLRSAVLTWFVLKGYEGIEAIPSEPLDQNLILERSKISSPEIKFSMPEELNNYIINELGEERWYKELEAMSKPAEVFLRVNERRISKEKLRELLAKQNILTEGVSGIKNALRLLKRSNLAALEEYRKGYFEVQDAGSQLISLFLAPNEGSVVIDACAGAGGKSLHLTDLMKNKGEIISMDIEDPKLKELTRRAERNKVSIINTKLIKSDTIKSLSQTADKLLLDVPCSGLGVIKRNPDAKEALTLDFIENIKATQQEILHEYSKMLKPGGEMVYATCSILPSENRNQVDEFLRVNTDYTLVKEQQIWPSETGFDGFYMALIQKK